MKIVIDGFQYSSKKVRRKKHSCVSCVALNSPELCHLLSNELIRRTNKYCARNKILFIEDKIVDMKVAKLGKLKLTGDTYYKCLMTNFLRRLDIILVKIEKGEVPDDFDLALLYRYRSKVMRTFKINRKVVPARRNMK